MKGKETKIIVDNPEAAELLELFMSCAKKTNPQYFLSEKQRKTQIEHLEELLLYQSKEMIKNVMNYIFIGNKKWILRIHTPGYLKVLWNNVTYEINNPEILTEQNRTINLDNEFIHDYQLLGVTTITHQNVDYGLIQGGVNLPQMKLGRF